jgi:para-aminobenzoate synthetase component 1
MDNLAQLQAYISRLTGFAVHELRESLNLSHLAARVAPQTGTVFLRSSRPGGQNMLAFDPLWKLTLNNGGGCWQVGETAWHFSAPPWDILATVLAAIPGATAATTFPGAWLGYLGYDLGNCSEPVPMTTIDDEKLPLATLFLPRLCIVEDRKRGCTRLISPLLQGKPVADLAQWEEKLSAWEKLPPPVYAAPRATAWESDLSAAEYRHSVSEIKARIARGEVYQVNMARRFSAAFHGHPYVLFARLFQANPSDYYAYLNLGEEQVVAASPELFIRQRGSRLSTWPIKGTRPRHTSREKDSELRRNLLMDRKEAAELAMVTDHLRNDLARVCRPGSVNVEAYPRLLRLANVQHTYSRVGGTLADGKTSVDILRALFPGASVSGCPKLAARQTIDELEKHRRGIFAGAIGYIGAQTMQLAIAIRTATVAGERINLWVGAGIVLASQPAREERETRHKAASFFYLLGAPQFTRAKSLVWQDGRFIDPLEAPAPVGPAVEAGAGLFETLLYDGGQLIFLEAHLARLQTSMEKLNLGRLPHVDWQAVSAKVASLTHSGEMRLGVKIMLRPQLNGRVSLRLQTRLLSPPDPAFSLCLFPEAWQNPLAEHKTMNYWQYERARLYAAGQACSAAILTLPDGTWLEANNGNLLCIQGDTVIIPPSGGRLLGVIEQEVIARLKTLGYTPVQRAFGLAEVSRSDALLFCNSLRGVIAVNRVEKHFLPASGDILIKKLHFW